MYDVRQSGHRRVLAILVAVVIASGGWAAEGERASACTGPGVSPTDPLLTAVVLGRVTGTEYTPRPQSGTSPPALRLHVTVEVDRYLRSSGASTVVIEDSSSAHGFPDDPDGVFWLGPCRAFAEDPTGKYLVAGIPSDMTQFSTFTVYGLGATVEDVQPGVDWVEEQLALAGVTPASAGHGVEASSTPYGALGLGVLAMALVAGARRFSRG